MSGGGNVLTDNWLTDAYQIIGSDPGAIAALAEQWQALGIAVSTVKPETIDASLTQAAANWRSGGTALNSYGQELGDKLTALANTAQQVAAGLRDYAEQLAKARSDLYSLMITIGVAVASSAVALALPEALAAAGVVANSTKFGAALISWVRPAGATTSILALITAVRSYFAYAADLGSMLTDANAQLAALNRMSTAGGILPALPQLPPTPN